MSEPDTVTVQVTISWLEARMAVEEFLNPTCDLPPELRERELYDLQVLIAITRLRLREEN